MLRQNLRGWALSFSLVLAGCAKSPGDGQPASDPPTVTASHPKPTSVADTAEEETATPVSAPAAPVPARNSTPLAAKFLGIDADAKYNELRQNRTAVQDKCQRIDAWVKQTEQGGSGAADAARELSKLDGDDWILVITAPSPERIPQSRFDLVVQLFAASNQKRSTSSKLREVLYATRADDERASQALLVYARQLPESAPFRLIICQSIIESVRKGEFQREAAKVLAENARLAESYLFQTVRGHHGQEESGRFAAVMGCAGPSRCYGVLKLVQVMEQGLSGTRDNRQPPSQTSRSRPLTRFGEYAELERNERDSAEVDELLSLRAAANVLREFRQTHLRELAVELQLHRPELAEAQVGVKDEYEAATAIAHAFCERELYLAAAQYFELAANLAIELELPLASYLRLTSFEVACRFKVDAKAAAERLTFLSQHDSLSIQPLAQATIAWLQGDLAEKAGDLVAAEQHRLRAAKLFGEAVPKPNSNAETCVSLAQAWLQVGEPSLAAAALKQLHDSMPTLDKDDPSIALRAGLLAAQSQLMLGNAQQAINDAENAIALQQSDAVEKSDLIRLRIALARALRECGDLNRADQVLSELRVNGGMTELERTAPQNALLLSQFDHELGVLRLRQGFAAEAKELLLSAYMVRVHSLGEHAKDTIISGSALAEASQAVATDS